MGMMNISAYGEGLMYTPSLSTNLAAIQTAGWDSLVLGLFHLDSKGNISFNDIPIIANQQGNSSYIGDSSWPGLVSQLVRPADGATTTINSLLASFGGWGVGDFANLQAIYEANGNSFSHTALQQNFALFRITFPQIDLIDMDVEYNYDQPSFVEFCQMLDMLGFGITFCPYTMMSFWAESLAALNSHNPGLVKYINLQCYDGGARNTPQQWAQAIEEEIPGFNTDAFIVAGDWANDSPSAVTAFFNSFDAPACLGGGFIWTIDQIISSEFPMAEYTAAIRAASQAMTNSASVVTD